jgi:hypothetical protein
MIYDSVNTEKYNFKKKVQPTDQLHSQLPAIIVVSKLWSLHYMITTSTQKASTVIL